jgi:hypothetical protein
MPYFPIAPGSDNRKKLCMTPVVQRNVMLARPSRASASRSPFVAIPTPGRRLLASLPANVRGIFAEPGAQNGDLFAVAGSTLYRISDAWTYAGLGIVPGGDVVTLRAMRSNLMLRAAGTLNLYDGSSLTQVTDVDAPANASTLAIVGNRVVAANATTDGFDWSKAGLPLVWDVDGAAADIDLPDPIIGQEEISGDLWSFNSRSIQPWQATGGSEAEAFSPITGAAIPRGLIGREAIAKIGAGRIFLGDDKVAYGTSGLSVNPIVNPDMEDALEVFTEAELAVDAIAWSYKVGSKEFWVLRSALDRAFCYDVAEGVWHERTRFGADQYDVAFAARAYGSVVVASPDSGDLWALDPDVFDDAGNPIERVMTFNIPVGADTSVNRLVFDMRCRDQPVSGQGSEPTMMLNWSTDGGETWALQDGNLREVSLPGPGVYGMRIQSYTFGLAKSETGWLLQITITDPIRFSLAGIWVNPTEDELK